LSIHKEGEKFTGISPIGLDPLTGFDRDQRGGDHATGTAQGLDPSLEYESTHARFVAEPDLSRSLLLDLLDHLGDILLVIPDGPLGQFARVWVDHGYGMLFLVAVQGNECYVSTHDRFSLY
jgi:hypothetical protein